MLVWGWFFRGFLMIFWSQNLMGASKEISKKSLRNTGHGDKIKGQRFINLVKNLKKYDKFACFLGLRF